MTKSGAWPVVELGDYVDLFTGFPFKSGNYTTAPTDVRLLRGDNVGQGRLRWDDAKRYPANVRHEYAKFELDEGDVILAMDRPWIEAGLKFAWVTRADRPTLLVQRVARLRGKAGLNTTFLRYVIGSPQFTEHVQSITTGVNVPHISGRDISRYRFALPPQDAQHAVAACLAPYDDLIENNTRRIAILEEMARRIFEEWFIHFRAPGCEGLPLVESELGPIPQGWGVKAIGSVFTTGSGGTPSRKRDTYFGGEINWVKTKELLDCPIFSTEEKITQEGLENSSAKIFPAYTVLVGMYGANIGQLGVLVEPAATNQACCAIISKAAPGWAFCYLTLQNARGRLIGLRAGAAQQNVSQAIIRDFPVTVGPDQIHTRFERVVAPIIGLSFSLYRQIANLRAQRDLLLPKLTSGEIDLTEAAALPQAAE